MKRINCLLLFIVLTITSVHNGFAQNINTLSSVSSNMYNQVFDAAGNMYFIHDAAKIYKMDATTGATSVCVGTSQGYSGDGGQASSAKINAPVYLAMDNAGNLFIGEEGNYVVREVNTAGVISTVTGIAASGSGFSGDGGPASAALISQPRGLAVDPLGNLYIADHGNNRIRKVDGSGNISTIAGNGTAAFSGDGGVASSSEISLPDGIAVDAPGAYLYIADHGNHRIRRIDLSSGGYISTIAGISTSGYNGDSRTAISAKLKAPTDVKVDCLNNIYIADDQNYRIRMIDGSGMISTVAGTGTHATSGDGYAATGADIWDPTNVSIDLIGNLYLPDNGLLRMVCNAYTAPTITVVPDPSNCTSTTSNTFHATLSTPACGNLVYDWNVGGYDNYTSSPDYTDILCAPGNPVYCTISYSTNAINDYCTGGTPSVVSYATSNTVYEEGNGTHPSITGFDINTLCAPGSSGATAPSPQYNASVNGGVTPYTYNWSMIFGTATLDDYTISNPTVTYAATGVTAYNLIVTDLAGCIDQHAEWTNFIDHGWDLASKDNPFDLYMEPYTLSLYSSTTPEKDVWSSSDVWNRYHADGLTTHETPAWWAACSGCTYGASNYFYTRVRNVGCIASPDADDGCLRAPFVYGYWTLGSPLGAEIWTPDWTIAMYPGSGTGGLPQVHKGYAMPGVAIPSISAGSSSIVYQYWNPPNPLTYQGKPSSMSLCFLSRIVDDHNQSSCGVDVASDGMSVQETYGVNPTFNVKSNNNIVTLNTADMHLSSAPKHSHIYTLQIGNPGDIGNTPVSLQFINDFSKYPYTGTSLLSGSANFKVYLGDIYDKWQTAGSHGTYGTLSANEKAIIFDGSSTIVLDSILLDTGVQYSISIEPYLLDGIDGSLMQEEVINVRGFTDDSGVSIGSFSYHVKYDGNPAPHGVLAVTEISQGPGAYPGCEYAEFMVTACDTVPSAYVDVSGWVIDDNAGNFDLEGCVSGFGITKGHYRLAYNSVWQNMPTGSKIVVYNAAVNCYNLSDTFFVDSTNNIYWVPVYDTMQPGAYVLERYGGEENLSMCHYCSDTGATLYTNAYNWSGTIDLNNSMDALQVRCPGCTIAASGTPAFYHGIGYAPSDTSGFISITSGLNEIGEPYIANIGSAAHHKYVFIGANAGDFDDATKWTPFTPESAGSCPTSLGKVDSVLNYSASTNTLGLPCCGSSGLRQAHTHGGNGPGGIARTDIRVYPNPANTTLNFEFPKGDEVNIKLMDITGRIMEQQVVHNDSHASIDVHSYSPGMYIYQVLSNGKIKSGKIVVQ